MISYEKLWVILKERGLKKKDLPLSAPTIAKLSKNKNIAVDKIEEICKFLKVQPGEIMTYIADDVVEEAVIKLDESAKKVLDVYKEQGLSTEEVINLFQNAIPELLRSLDNGEKPATEAYKEIKDTDNN